MPSPSHAIGLEPWGRVLEDRARVVEAEGALIVAVADGAGGTSHGDRAAEHVVRAIDPFLARGLAASDELEWATFLEETDRAIARDPDGGESTAIVLGVTSEWICGASVGDSEAWLMTAGDWHVLTASQRRKPLLGTGRAWPMAFRLSHAGGVLVVGSDGLFKYAPAARIRDVAVRQEPDAACRSLVNLVRLPNGTLQDDVAVVVCDVSRLAQYPGPGGISAW